MATLDDVGHPAVRTAAGIALLVLAVLLPPLAYRRWSATERALRTGESLPEPGLLRVTGRTVRLGPVSTHSTSLLVGGLLFIGVGVIFLRYDGTAGLTGALGLGDTTDVEFAAQRLVADWASSVPPWTVPLVVGVLAAWVAWRRQKASADEDRRPVERSRS